MARSGEGIAAHPEGSSHKASAQGGSPETQRKVLEGQAEQRRRSTSKVKNRAKDLAEKGAGLAEKTE